MNELKEIRANLIEISEKESIKLFRLARKMKRHNCSETNIATCREEAFLLHLNAYPERLLNPFQKWEYAFK